MEAQCVLPQCPPPSQPVWVAERVLETHCSLRSGGSRGLGRGRRGRLRFSPQPAGGSRKPASSCHAAPEVCSRDRQTACGGPGVRGPLSPPLLLSFTCGVLQGQLNPLRRRSAVFSGHGRPKMDVGAPSLRPGLSPRRARSAGSKPFTRGRSGPWMWTRQRGHIVVVRSGRRGGSQGSRALPVPSGELPFEEE